jgi:hypothetical protein
MASKVKTPLFRRPKLVCVNYQVRRVYPVGWYGCEVFSNSSLKKATPKALGSLESEKAKVQRLLAHAQELEAMVEAPFDPAAAGLLVPDVVERPDKAGPAGRKRLTAMHGSVTMHAGGWGGG